jgi:hypothetical protein
MEPICITIQKILEEAVTESIEVGPGVQVCRITTTRRPTFCVVETGEWKPDENQVTTSVQEKVTHTIALPVVRNARGEEEHQGNFCIVEPRLLEKLRMGGWFSDSKEYDLISKEPFTRVLSGKPYKVVRLKSYDHTVFDLEGNPLPVGLYFDYINGRVSNRVFKIKGLLEHLKSRSDVTLLQEKYSDDFVHRIPSYNSDSGSTHLSFIWNPDAEVYREFRKRVQESTEWDAKYSVAHQMMGNDAFRLPEKADDDE